MKSILIALFVIAPLTQASEWGLELGVGAIQAQTPEDGFWHQKLFDHSVDIQSPTFRVGARYGPWSVGYRDLGNFSATALAVEDESYAQLKQGALIEEEPLLFKTKGKVTGTYISREFAMWGDTYFTLGAWYGRTTWKINKAEEPRLSATDESWSWLAGFGHRTGNVRVWAEAWEIYGAGGWYPIYEGVSGNAGVTLEF